MSQFSTSFATGRGTCNSSDKVQAFSLVTISNLHIFLEFRGMVSVSGAEADFSAMVNRKAMKEQSWV
jgi:hypothetical protein